ncbi:hypothetical protein FOZ61_002234 [Perkinsus olseni]|uniref:Uncharacterized protein n=1 Tax=Perkinsus olseni TaxID=32597 RepID=A0A7J6LTW5_PEROL|nr:hypothetical protein FOZ61_002234 [Perkinsus olseni]
MTLQPLVAPPQNSVIVPAPYDPRVAKDEPFHVTLIATCDEAEVGARNGFTVIAMSICFEKICDIFPQHTVLEATQQPIGNKPAEDCCSGGGGYRNSGTNEDRINWD